MSKRLFFYRCPFCIYKSTSKEAVFTHILDINIHDYNIIEKYGFENRLLVSDDVKQNRSYIAAKIFDNLKPIIKTHAPQITIQEQGV